MSAIVVWYEISETELLQTPSLAVYPQRIRANIERMLQFAAPPSVCPHVKTHKTPQVLKLYDEFGIKQFKCATISELEMVAASNAEYALLAMQPVGPAAQRIAQLSLTFPGVNVATIVDNASTLNEIANVVSESGAKLEVLLDIDNGMHRTGIPCNDSARDLYELIVSTKGVEPGGLHVYDGHIHDSDPVAREQRVEECMASVLNFRNDLLARGLPVPKLVTGGTPSFPAHAKHIDRTCSPGTPVFWDAGYAHHFPDLDFLPAAVLLTRVISQLDTSLYCTDLGYKAVASEMPAPRTKFLSTKVHQEVGHSEEHLVIQVAPECDLSVGELLYVLPWHICPTVARQKDLLVVEDHQVVDTWPILARDRSITI